MDGSETMQCPACGGAGSITVNKPGSMPRLDGTREQVAGPCPQCGGQGILIGDDAAAAAKRALQDAVRAYYDVMAPNEKVTAWVVVTHRVSPQLDAVGESTVGSTSSVGTPWPMLVGMLDAAQKLEQRA